MSWAKLCLHSTVNAVRLRVRLFAAYWPAEGLSFGFCLTTIPEMRKVHSKMLVFGERSSSLSFDFDSPESVPDDNK